MIGKPGFIRDLFMGPNNAYWDLGRILSFAAGAAMLAAQAWNIRLGIPIDLAALGTGFGAILVGAAGLIFVKDRAATGSGS